MEQDAPAVTRPGESLRADCNANTPTGSGDCPDKKGFGTMNAETTAHRKTLLIVMSMTLLLCVSMSNIETQAATFTSASCSQPHVQSAVNAAGRGDVVMIPAGACTWNAGVTIPSAKKITIQGAGKTATVITMVNGGTAVFLGTSGSRVTGIGFSGARLNVDGTGWRIDHCDFAFSTFGTAVLVAGNGTDGNHPTGLVDNCTFYNSEIIIYGWLGLAAHRIWSQPLELGTGRNTVYIEDCSWNGPSDGSCYAVNSNYGGNFVFRHNSVRNCNIENHALQASDTRGSKRSEIYNNTISYDSPYWVPVYFRGGTGVIFNNIINPAFSNYAIFVDNRRSCETLGTLCDGNSGWDGNTGYQGYPCRDQIGRGPDSAVWAPGQPYTQTLEPLYEWNNCRNALGCANGGPNDVNIAVVGNCARENQHIVQNRDFYNNTQRPGYTPYTYPHPYRTGSTQNVAPPENLRIIGFLY
jgi:hypothetical protein